MGVSCPGIEYWLMGVYYDEMSALRYIIEWETDKWVYFTMELIASMHLIEWKIACGDTTKWNNGSHILVTKCHWIKLYWTQLN